MRCPYKHNYITVNNSYLLPASDIDLDTQKWGWRTERVCEECGVLAVNQEI